VALADCWLNPQTVLNNEVACKNGAELPPIYQPKRPLERRVETQGCDLNLDGRRGPDLQIGQVAGLVRLSQGHVRGAFD
jgi:hypothetical protein